MIDVTSSEGETDTLAQSRPNLEDDEEFVYIGATIDISPLMMTDMSLITKSKKKDYRRWELFSADEQQEILKQYITKCYKPLCDKLIVGYEFTKKLMVHAHLMLGIKDSDIATDYHLRQVRVMVQRYHESSRIFKSSKYNKHMNWIHDLKQKGPKQWIEYITKSYGCMPKSVQMIGSTK